MKIHIEEYYGGWSLVIDDKRFSFNQEDGIENLQDALRLIKPDAEVTYEECY